MIKISIFEQIWVNLINDREKTDSFYFKYLKKSNTTSTKVNKNIHWTKYFILCFMMIERYPIIFRVWETNLKKFIYI
jgi:hypothetical protein